MANDVRDLASQIMQGAGYSKGINQTSTTAFSVFGVGGVNSPFMPAILLDGTLWDKLVPYRFVVIDTKRNNKIVCGSEGQSASAEVVQEKGSTLIKFTPIDGKWQFVLPITPQQLSITDQYAINTSATLRGVLEEHNGVKFKNISIAGTMGMWPYRNTIDSVSKNSGILNSIFSNTVSSAQNLGNQFSKLIQTATNKHSESKPISSGPGDFGLYTGFYLAQAFQQFLEQYAEAKKDPRNASWRLVLDIPKQSQALVVTPMQFSWQQSESKPQLVNYTLQLKAWRRIDLENSSSSSSANNFSLTPGLLQRALNTVTEARKLMSASLSLIGAVRSDVEKPLDVLRQTALFLKDLAGVAVTAADLPFQIQRDYSSSIKESINISQDAIKSVNTNPKVRDAIKKIAESVSLSEGLTLNNISSGQLGNNAITAQQIDPSNNIFSNPQGSFEIFNEVPVGSLLLNSSQQNNITEVIEDAAATSVDDLRQYRQTIQELAFQLSNYFGAGDAFYNEVYGKPAPATRLQPLTLDEYELLNSLYNAMQSYDQLTATTQVDDLDKQISMDYVAGLADLADIDFNTSTSKILAPVPFGLTIEQIALRYLKDPQRWIEIATLNNLREPYIDENGFQNELLSNGSERNITIDNIDNLYVGQKVSIRSSSQIPSNRIILDIKRLSDTSFLITLDGLPNLESFTTADNAYMQAYLPGTVNSQQKIFIPSELPVPNDPNIIVPSSTSQDPLTALSKVDLLLTEYGDLAVNNYGDFRFAYGMTNIIQALKIKVGTQRGTNLFHPDFGLGIKPGMSSAEVNLPEIYASLNELIRIDSRFNGLSSLQLQLNGSALIIDMGVELAGQRGVYPIRFELNN